MAFNNDIFKLARHAASNKGYVADTANYSSTDVQVALREELKKYVGDYYSFKKNKLDLYELIAQSFDEIIPAKVEKTVGAFAEIQTVPQNTKLTFRKKLGRTRAKQFVGRVSPAGRYETFRLDADQFDIAVHAIGGGVQIDWERYISGLDDWNDLVDIMMEALEEDIYKEINLELLSSYNALGRPANTKVSTANFDTTEMRDLVNVVRSYGEGAVIFAPWQFVSAMGDGLTYGPSGATQNVAPEDIADLRQNGFIGMFYGAPVVALANNFTDETNSHYQLNPRVAFVLPVGKEKIVKVGFEGDTIVDDTGFFPGDHSMSMMVYKKVGTAILYTNNWGIYEITSIVDTAWAGLT